MAADDVKVSNLVTPDNYTANQNQALNIPASGVLSNDTSVFGQPLTAIAVVNPANGTLNLNTNGGFTYTPGPNYSGTDKFMYQANDGQTNIGTAWVTIVVNPSTNVLPVIQSIKLSNNVVTLTWASVAGRTYRAQYNSNLLTSTWSNIVPDVLASGPTATATNSVGTTPRRFYRVLLLP
jgi:hypothetical protein